MGPNIHHRAGVKSIHPVWGVVGLLIAALLMASVAGCASGERRPASDIAAHRPVALVYRGPAEGCDGCAEAVAALLRRAPQHFAVDYIGPHERRALTAANLRGATIYAQPGGNASVASAMRALGPDGAAVIKQYVAGGGRYLGFCMGAYLAGSDPGMGLLLPGDTGEYNQTRGALVTSTAEVVIPVRWGRTTHDNFAQDPPHIIASNVRGERVLSRFSNGAINALVRPYGRGALGVVGTHPEADRSWYTETLWRQDHDGLDHQQGLQLIAAVLAV